MTNGPSAIPSNESPSRFFFSKQNRLLRRSEFLEVYNQGFRVSGPCFAAFCWRSPAAGGPKFGFTTPRALGNSVLRNRMKRRLREQVRLLLPRFAPEWRIVFNLRRAALAVPAPQIASEIQRLADRCAR